MDAEKQFPCHFRSRPKSLNFATKSVVLVQRQFRREFPGRKIPHRNTTRSLIQKFRDSGSVTNNKTRSGARLTARTPARVQDIRTPLEQSPQKSTTDQTDVRRSLDFQVCDESHWFIATWNCFHTRCRFLMLKARPTKTNAMNFARVSAKGSRTILVYWTFFSSLTRHISTWTGLSISRTWGSGLQRSLMRLCKHPECWNKQISPSTSGGILLYEIASGQEWLILLRQSSRILVRSWTETELFLSVHLGTRWTWLVAALYDSPENEIKILILISLEYTSF